jgi:aminopeptidase
VKDHRYEKLAKVLVQYSLGVKRGDLVSIVGAPLAEPLVVEVYREVLKAGAHGIVKCQPPALGEVFFKTAQKHQLEYVSPVAEFETEKVDKVVSIWADDNTKSLSGVDPKKQAARSAATRKLFKRFLEREAKGELKWVGTQFPCNASAQDAEMSLDEYEDFVLRACLVHLPNPTAAWRAVHAKQEKIVRFLNKRKTFRIVAKDTDLTFKAGGRKWVNCDGGVNMPDGEIFTGPIEDTAEGTIAFSFPAFYAGREATGVKLTFKKGKVVKATAAKGENVLTSLLDTDPGARRVGEVAIGTNYGIDRFTRNTLFDEKIGGTVHMALGASLPESGGVNESGIHWDIVTDMRDGGLIYADGKVIYRNGKFVIK